MDPITEILARLDEISERLSTLEAGEGEGGEEVSVEQRLTDLEDAMGVLTQALGAAPPSEEAVKMGSVKEKKRNTSLLGALAKLRGY
jgi:hypothetical protein